jgi:hypothetical protein
MPETSTPPTAGRLILLLGGLVVGLEIGLWVAIVHYYPSLIDRANFGNMFGGINTLFAGLGFAGLIGTLILQQRALALQSRSLIEQSEEIQRQNRRQERQAFESMLVQLLGFHHEIAKEMHLRLGAATFEGRAAFRALADELQGIIANYGQQNPDVASVKVAQRGYEQFHSRYRGVLDHYFRNLYHIVKFVDRSGIEDPKQYTSLVRAQLSPPELLLLFYNGASAFGEKFKPLIEKFALLEQLPDTELPNIGHKALYENNAYAVGGHGDS